MPGSRHPALILQRDEVNASRIDTVVVCVLTSNVALARAPGNVRLPRKMTRLPRDSVVNASQLSTINKSNLDTLIGKLPPRVLREVDEGLRWFLRLGDD